jgi:putative oxidoreductase
MEKLSAYAPFVARLFIGGFFLLAGVGKVADLAGTAGYMQSVGLPGFLALPAALFEIAVALSLLLGYQLRLISLLGAGFCIVTALLFHNNFADQSQMINFLKNFSIAGAFLMFFSFGAGKLAIDKA